VIRFRAYFEQHTGEPWPKLGDTGPGGESLTVMLFETIADYLDELHELHELHEQREASTVKALIQRLRASG
jgi:hypothetical protein